MGFSQGLSHVAIAVADLDAAVAFYRDVLGLRLHAVEEIEEQQVKAALFGEGMGRIELISPTHPDSPVGRFLQKRGEGLHHICIEVDDIEAALAELKRQGAMLIDQEPKIGAGGAKIAFVHPRGNRGVLTELRQALR
jgi:methylmalonyl-CoA/ethylmalonyl-CoA epimerase